MKHKPLRNRILASTVRQVLKGVFTLPNPDHASLLKARKKFNTVIRLSPSGSLCPTQPVSNHALRGEWLTPDQFGKRIFLYVHGGGFYVGSPESHRPLTQRLARQSRSRVFSLDYRLAPEATAPAWVEDCSLAYLQLLEMGHLAEHIVMAGDSAGGNIVLASLMHLRDHGHPLPAAAILLSPWTDLTVHLASHERLAHIDAMLNHQSMLKLGRWLSQGQDIKNPLLSPYFGDFSNLPPMLFQVSDSEILFDDSKFCVQKANACGSHAELSVWSGMVHVFQLFGLVLPEARAAIDEITDFADRFCPVDA